MFSTTRTLRIVESKFTALCHRSHRTIVGCGRCMPSLRCLECLGFCVDLFDELIEDLSLLVVLEYLVLVLHYFVEVSPVLGNFLLEIVSRNIMDYRNEIILYVLQCVLQFHCGKAKPIAYLLQTFKVVQDLLAVTFVHLVSFACPFFNFGVVET